MPAQQGEDPSGTGGGLYDPVSPEPMPVHAPQPTQRYRLGKELGRGGMGRVVEAFDLQLGRTVALKEVLPKTGSGTARRFKREIHITARLEHASIVPLYDSGVSDDGRPYYVMRRVSGRPLDEMIARARGLGERLTLLPALLDAIDAVAHAHNRSVIHRDLKPANILLGELGETVVIDWGLAKVIGEEDEEVADRPSTPGDSLRTQMGSVFGTPGFMAPEQARGEELGTHGDVYALGACLYQLLAGAPPVAGVSATEVMDKTRTHDIRPLSQAAPGAPLELVAIVGKALAFDPAERYPNAGALGEDVRRFLAGQLVAAHSYTNREKLARFAKRHRAALVVAALAAVAVAVMAWIGVHRIITERDAANTARQDALAGRREAEEARDHLVERHDALLVIQASAMLDTNPTESLALLKQLSANSVRSADARAIAQAATTRGVAWAMPSTYELTTMVELDADAKRLVQVSRDGVIRVFDLERRRLMLERAFAAGSRAIWVSGNRLLVTKDRAPPQLLDVTANTLEPLALEPIGYAIATASGDRALILNNASAAVLDLATRTLRPLAFEKPVAEIAIAPDGSWMALGGGDLVVVLDRDGKELTRHAAPLARIVGSRFRSLAVVSDLQVFDCKLDPKPVWTQVPLPAPPVRTIDLAYRGEELDIFLTNGDLVAWNGKVVFQRTHVERFQPRVAEVGDETMIVPSGDGRLYWVNDLGRGSLAMPTTMNRLRIAVRPGAPRLVVVGDGIILTFDLSAVMPQRIRAPVGSDPVFVDDETVLLIGSYERQWRWLDLVSGKQSAFKYDSLAAPSVSDIDPVSGRMLLREGLIQPDSFKLIHKNSTKFTLITHGRDCWARLLAGDAVIYGEGDGRVFAKIGTAAPQEIVKLDGIAIAGVALGELRFAAHSSTGEVVRGDLATGKLERIQVPMGTDGFLSTDGAGHLLIIEDNRLLTWDTSIVELAKFDKAISRVDPVEGGILVQLGSEHALQYVELAKSTVPHRILPTSRGFAVVSSDGKLVAALGTAQDVMIVELPSRARWRLPTLAFTHDIVSVSPTSRRIMQTTNDALVLWQLPAIGSDLAGWLDNQTNATLDPDGVLLWPWDTHRSAP